MKKLFYGSLLVSIIAIDLYTKIWASIYCQHALVINRFITLQLTYNTGVAWSLGAQATPLVWWILMGMVGCVIVWLLHVMVERLRHNKQVWGETLVLGGALANTIDRLWHGAVTDFIVLSYQDYIWPVFNVADSAVVLGVIVMLYSLWKEES